MVPPKQAGHMTCTRPQAERQTRASSTHDPKRPPEDLLPPKMSFLGNGMLWMFIAREPFACRDFRQPAARPMRLEGSQDHRKHLR